MMHLSFFQVVGQGFRKIFVEVSVEFIDVSTWMMLDVGRSWPVLVDHHPAECGRRWAKAKIPP